MYAEFSKLKHMGVQSKLNFMASKTPEERRVFISLLNEEDLRELRAGLTWNEISQWEFRDSPQKTEREITADEAKLIIDENEEIAGLLLLDTDEANANIAMIHLKRRKRLRLQEERELKMKKKYPKSIKPSNMFEGTAAWKCRGGTVDPFYLSSVEKVNYEGATGDEKKENLMEKIKSLGSDPGQKPMEIYEPSIGDLDLET